RSGTGPEGDRLPVRPPDARGEAAVEQVERRVAERSAPPVVDAQGTELGRHPADPDPEHHAAPGELLHAGDPLCDEEWRTIGEDEDRCAEPDTRRRRGEKGKRDERLHVATV